MFSDLLAPFYDLLLGSDPRMLLLVAILFLIAVLVGIELHNLVLVRRVAYPHHDATLKRAEREAAAMLEKARKQADEVREKARKDAELLVAEREKKADEFSQRFEKQIQSLAEHHAKLLEKYSTLTRDTYREFEASMKRSAGEGEAAVKQEIDRLLTDLRSEHTELKRQLAKGLEEHLEREFTTAREAIDTYREMQLRMIDRRIVALVERVAALALQKELSVSDHADMVYRSLEEAKKQGIL